MTEKKVLINHKCYIIISVIITIIVAIIIVCQRLERVRLQVERIIKLGQNRKEDARDLTYSICPLRELPTQAK